ncbi:MAG: hypothetical protein H0T46_31525 [Deltaproteobacteria bacterium]|nr:hypothetical protein [Deltaproteobacteria bacterium]
MKALAVTLLLAPVLAEARPFDEFQGGSWLHYELTGLTDVDDTMRGSGTDAKQLVLAGARLHGFVGTNSTIGYHIGFDLALGGTINSGGFAYDVALFPVGVGVRVGRTGVIALGAGVQAIGATSTIDDAIALPLELNIEVGGGRIRLLARARASYIAGAAGRQSAAPSVPFADELDATVGVRLGRHYEDYGFPSGNGYFLGASYRELAGTRFAGVVIGYSIDMATPRKPRR